MAHRQSAPADCNRTRRGFALLVVLFGLAVITVLVSASGCSATASS